MKEFLNKKYTTTNGKILLATTILSIIVTIILTILVYKLFSEETITNLTTWLNNVKDNGNPEYIKLIPCCLIPIEFVVIDLISMATLVFCLNEDKKENKKIKKK